MDNSWALPQWERATLCFDTNERGDSHINTSREVLKRKFQTEMPQSYSS